MVLAMTSPLPLSGQSAFITGGGSGIGLGGAEALVRDGMSVTIMGRNADKLSAAADQLRAVAPHGATITDVAGDVTDEDSVAAGVAAAPAVTGKLDVCVAAAGDGTLGPIIAMSLEEWNRVINVSLTGVFLTFKHAGSAISRSGGGAMVAISSLAGTTTHRFMGPYNSAKAGVDMLVKTTADELGQVGVRVNGIRPGIIRTDLVSMITPEDSVGRSYLANMPISRFGEVSDVAPAIRFLCGPESSFITGELLNVDGGHHLRTGPDYHEWAAGLYGEAADGHPS